MLKGRFGFMENPLERIFNSDLGVVKLFYELSTPFKSLKSQMENPFEKTFKKKQQPSIRLRLDAYGKLFFVLTVFSLLKTLCVPRFPQRKKAPKNSFDFAYPICCHPAPRTQNFRDRLLYTWTLATIGGWRQGRLRHRINSAGIRPRRPKNPP